MKKINKLILLAFISIGVFTSCEDENIDGHDLTGSPVIIGWNQANITESYFSDIGTLNNTYALNILGGGDGSPLNYDINVTLDVDPASTAVDGKEFSLPNTSFVIPKGQKFANVPIDINTGSFNPSSPTTLIVNVKTSVNGVTVSGLAKQMRITFVGCQSQLALSTYNVTITRRNTGGVVSRSNVAMTELSVNSFESSYVGAWPLSPGVRFTDICGSLFIQSHDLANTFSNQVTAAAGPNNLAGTVDSNGNFKLTYSISGESSVSGPWGIYDAVYTKN